MLNRSFCSTPKIATFGSLRESLRSRFPRPSLLTLLKLPLLSRIKAFSFSLHPFPLELELISAHLCLSLPSPIWPSSSSIDRHIGGYSPNIMAVLLYKKAKQLVRSVYFRKLFSFQTIFACTPLRGGLIHLFRCFRGRSRWWRGRWSRGRSRSRPPRTSVGPGDPPRQLATGAVIVVLPLAEIPPVRKADADLLSLLQKQQVRQFSQELSHVYFFPYHLAQF